MHFDPTWNGPVDMEPEGREVVVSRRLRNRPQVNYTALSDVQLPRVERRPRRSSKAEEDVVLLGAQTSDTSAIPTPVYSLYRVLANQIKSALRAGRKDDPKVKIEIPFDQINFNGGLRMCGHLKRVWRGNEIYTITAYNDLDCLLDKNWHVRGVTPAGDFCYVVIGTVEFYLYKRRPLLDYIYSDAGVVKTERDQGHCLIFSFIRGDGTRDRFGIDSSIFV